MNSATAAPSERCIGTDERKRSASSPVSQGPTNRISLSPRCSGRVNGAGVVEARIAAHGKTYLSPHRLRATHDVVCDTGVFHRHEIRDLGHTAVGQEPGEQHVGVGQVELPVYRVVEPRRDLEAAAVIGVEEGRKYRRGIKRRKAEEVDRPVLAYQCDGVKVADDPVVFYGRVAVCQHASAVPCS